MKPKTLQSVEFIYFERQQVDYNIKTDDNNLQEINFFYPSGRDKLSPIETNFRFIAMPQKFWLNKIMVAFDRTCPNSVKDYFINNSKITLVLNDRYELHYPMIVQPDFPAFETNQEIKLADFEKDAFTIKKKKLDHNSVFSFQLLTKKQEESFKPFYLWLVLFGQKKRMVT